MLFTEFVLLMVVVVCYLLWQREPFEEDDKLKKSKSKRKRKNDTSDVDPNLSRVETVKQRLKEKVVARQENIDKAINKKVVKEEDQYGPRCMFELMRRTLPALVLDLTIKDEALMTDVKSRNFVIVGDLINKFDKHPTYGYLQNFICAFESIKRALTGHNYVLNVNVWVLPCVRAVFIEEEEEANKQSDVMMCALLYFPHKGKNFELEKTLIYQLKDCFYFVRGIKQRHLLSEDKHDCVYLYSLKNPQQGPKKTLLTIHQGYKSMIDRKNEAIRKFADNLIKNNPKMSSQVSYRSLSKRFDNPIDNFPPQIVGR